MKKNLDKPTMQLDGTPAMRPSDTKKDDAGRPVMEQVPMRQIIAEALSLQMDETSGGVKLAMGKLAFKLVGGSGDIDLTVDELKLIEKAVEKSCSPLVVCQVDAALNE